MNDQDPLDQLLHEWDAHHQPTDQHLRDLRARVSSAVADQTATARMSPRMPWRQICLPLAGIAAILLILVSVWQTQPERISVTEVTPAIVEFDSRSLAGQAILLAEIERVFNDRVSWVAESSGHVDIGLSEHDLEPGRPLMLRLMLAKYDVNEGSWSQLWSVDVLSRNQTTVSVRPRTVDDVQVDMWAYVLPDGMVAIDTNLVASGSVPWRSNTNRLQQPGEPIEVASRHVNGTEYRIYQTVALLTES